MENQLPEKKTLNLPDTEHTSLGLEGKVTQAIFFIDNDYQPLALAEDENAEGCTRMLFVFTDGTFALFEHHQDCCEFVAINDICGDTEDLIGVPLTMAEVATQEGNDAETDWSNDAYIDDSITWTFYRFQTTKGSLVVRWLGSSNGYYSEEVEMRTGKLSTLRGEKEGKKLLTGTTGIEEKHDVRQP